LNLQNQIEWDGRVDKYDDPYLLDLNGNRRIQKEGNDRCETIADILFDIMIACGMPKHLPPNPNPSGR